MFSFTVAKTWRGDKLRVRAGSGRRVADATDHPLFDHIRRHLC